MADLNYSEFKAVRIARVMALLLVLTASLFFAEGVLAHVEGKMQLSAADAGPFKITAWTSPDPAEVGEVHVALSIFLAEDASPVLDADVTVSMVPQVGGENLTTMATTEDSANNFLYEAILETDEPGKYDIAIEVQGVEGNSGSASFELEVVSGGSILPTIIAVVLGAVSLVLVFAARRRSKEIADQL